MFKWIFAFALIAGVLAQLELTEDQKTLFRNSLKGQCKKVGNEAAAAEVETAAETFVTCVKGLFDVNTLKKEIEEAKPNGALDEVFKKYCEKSPQLKSCIHDLTGKVTKCVDADLRDKMGLVNNGTDQLIDFVCFKDGDRIALFIAEGGPECFQEKSNQIRECAEKLKEAKSIDDIKSKPLAEQCAKFHEVSDCVVKALEQCSTPTPGNMAEALFRFVLNGTPCKLPSWWEAACHRAELLVAQVMAQVQETLGINPENFVISHPSV